MLSIDLNRRGLSRRTTFEMPESWDIGNLSTPNISTSLETQSQLKLTFSPLKVTATDREPS